MQRNTFSILNTISYLFLLGNLLVLIFIVYKIIRDGSFDYLKLYLYFGIISSSFYFFNLFFRKTLKTYVAIVTLTILFSLYSFQTYIIFTKLNLGVGKKEISLYEKKFNKKFDTRSKLEIYQDLKKKEDITIAVTPFNLRKDNDLKILPLSGISLKKTILCNELGYYAMFNSDRFGFNNPDNEWEKKQTFAVLVGDSFVHGSCVEPPNDISGVLRSKINHGSIINLGQAGNAPLTQYASLREYLEVVKNVKYVIWFHYEANDLYSDFKEELDNKILKNYIEDENFTQNLDERQQEINEILQKRIDKILNNEIEKTKSNKKNLIINFIKLNEVRYALFKKRKSEIEKPYLIEFKKIIKLSKKLVNEKNATFYFVYLPSYSYTRKNFVDKDYNDVKKIIEDLNITFVDINELVFKKEENPKKLFPFEIWNHYTIDGYKKVANAVFDEIKK